MRSAGGGRWRNSDNEAIKGRGAGRGRGSVRMYNLRSTASEKLEGKQILTTREKGGRKSDIRTYVRNGMEQQSSLTRRSKQNKNKGKKVTFNDNNNAGENENTSNENTQDERDMNSDDDIRSLNEIKRKCDSKNKNDAATWTIPSKTVKPKGMLIIESNTEKESVTENAFSILQEDMERHERENYGKKRAKR